MRKSALCTDLQQRRLRAALPHRLFDAFVICSKDISIALLWHEEASVAEQAGLGPNWSDITKGRLPRDNVFQ